MDFFKAMQERHACKEFDDTKKIDSNDLNNILEAGRLSPSSFGLEHWKFLVIQNEELKAKLRPLCWNQVQITSSSELIVILAKTACLKPDNRYIKDMLFRRDYPQEKKDFYLKLYGDFIQDKLESKALYGWSRAQCYIASANMMTYASSIGIDSCPIEGFEKEGVEKLLNIDTNEFELALILPFGYRKNPASDKKRLPFDKVVEFIK